MSSLKKLIIQTHFRHQWTIVIDPLRNKCSETNKCSAKKMFRGIFSARPLIWFLLSQKRSKGSLKWYVIVATWSGISSKRFITFNVVQNGQKPSYLNKCLVKNKCSAKKMFQGIFSAQPPNRSYMVWDQFQKVWNICDYL